MAKGVKPRVKVPKSAAAGDVVTIKTLISHKMESGQRKDKEGNIIPRSIINRFTCDFVGASQSGNVIDVQLSGAISTNPYFEFEAKVPESGEFKFTWYDDDGSVYETAKSITVA
ncbi:MAG: thiosulfate oxidation carrier complex protein SoxZ [Alphaproteobacteria bacterium]|nr:MAG: thiosulfate oxidation carrier complex protein SoxZ [Alphaproteobacteria bacterium]